MASSKTLFASLLRATTTSSSITADDKNDLKPSLSITNNDTPHAVPPRPDSSEILALAKHTDDFSQQLDEMVTPSPILVYLEDLLNNNNNHDHGHDHKLNTNTRQKQGKIEHVIS